MVMMTQILRQTLSLALPSKKEQPSFFPARFAKTELQTYCLVVVKKKKKQQNQTNNTGIYKIKSWRLLHSNSTLLREPLLTV